MYLTNCIQLGVCNLESGSQLRRIIKLFGLPSSNDILTSAVAKIYATVVTRPVLMQIAINLFNIELVLMVVVDLWTKSLDMTGRTFRKLISPKGEAPTSI